MIVEDDPCGCSVVFVIFSALLLAGVFVGGIYQGKKEERNKAIEMKVGRWQTDPKTGDTDFVYGPEDKK